MLQIKKLGVVIVLVSLVASLFIGVLTNTTTTNETVTDYNFVADMSQTFTYSNEPDYVEYNPAKNYSGYVTSDNASSGIKYTASTGASNYRVLDSYSASSTTRNINTVLTTDTTIDPPKHVDDGIITSDKYAVIVEHYSIPSGGGAGDYALALRDGAQFGTEHLSDALGQLINLAPSSATTVTIDFASHTNVVISGYGPNFINFDSNLVYYAPYQWDSTGQTGYWPYSMTPAIMEEYHPGDVANVQYPIKYDRERSTYYFVTGSGDVAFDPSSYVIYWSLTNPNTDKPYPADRMNWSNGSTSAIAPPMYIEEGEWTSNVYVSWVIASYKSMKINDGIRIANTDSSITTDWKNDVDNAIIDIVFGKNNNTLMENTFTLNYTGGTTQELTVTRADNGSVTLTKGTDEYTIGTWDNFLVRLNGIEGTVTVYPITSFTNYTTFTATNTPINLGSSPEVAIPTGTITSISYANVTTNPTIVSENGDGLTSFTLSVSNTTIQLTNKLLMVDPSININDYFNDADADGWRLYFYSFVTQGTSMTVNGQTYSVSNGNITIDGKDYRFNNTYVSYDKLTDHMYLTFVNEKITLDLGEWTTSVISFTGLWFFNTSYYEAYVSDYTNTSIQWMKIPPMGTVALIFIAITIILMAIGIRTIGFELPDYIVTIVSLVVALCILEAFI